MSIEKAKKLLRKELTGIVPCYVDIRDALTELEAESKPELSPVLKEARRKAAEAAGLILSKPEQKGGISVSPSLRGKQGKPLQVWGSELMAKEFERGQRKPEHVWCTCLECTEQREQAKHQSKPEPTEFIREFRHLLQCGIGAGQSTYEAIWEFGERACDLIEIQAEQLKDKHTISSEDASYLRKVSAENLDLKVKIENQVEQLKSTNHNMKLYADERNELRKQFAAIEKEIDTLKSKNTAAISTICDQERLLDQREKEIERPKTALRSIQTWANAYPLDVFVKPDLKKAAKVLKENGMTLDAISADAMRHVLDGIKEIVEQGMKGEQK